MSKTLLATFTLLLIGFALSPNGARSGPSQTPSTQSASLETRLRQFVVDEIGRRLVDARRSVTDEATRTIREAERVERMTNLFVIAVGTISTIAIGLVAGLLVWGALVGNRERKDIDRIKQDAQGLVDRARSAVNEVDEHVRKLQNMRKESEEIFGRYQKMGDETGESLTLIKKDFDRLPKLEAGGIVGRAVAIPIQSVAEFEAADGLIVLAERFKVLDSAEAVDALVKLGAYARVARNYPRSLARLSRAIALDPGSAAAHLELAETLYLLAAESRLGEEYKKKLLDRAEDECRQTEQIVGRNAKILYNYAWIEDERGDYDKAINFYRQVKVLVPEHVTTTYNLAVSLCKDAARYQVQGNDDQANRRYEECLQELQLPMKDPESREAIFREDGDQDFEPLRRHPVYGPQLSRLYEEASKDTTR